VFIGILIVVGIVLTVIMVVSSISAVFFNRPHQPVSNVVLIISGAIAMIGVALILLQSVRMERLNASRRWPTVEGKVDSSQVVQIRSYVVPKISYSYAVAGKTYTADTDLQTPGFGGKSTRIEKANELVHLYPAGKTVMVYYDSHNPETSKLIQEPAWDIYIRLGTGIFLFGGGFAVFSLYAIRRISHKFV
jgi:hypothetical protein